jgi:YegS/Rv2252/BmrU family lipid kinase
MPKSNKRIHAKLIANPGAGQVLDQASLLTKTARCLMDCGLDVDVALERPTKQAARAAKQAVEDGYDLVIGMGGDGTIGGVIRGMVNSGVPLGVIAAGTENDFAHTLGIPDDVEAACQLIASGKTRPVDLGRLKTKKTDRFDFFMVTAIGLVATVFPMIKNIPEGDYSGIMDAVKTLLRFNSSPRIYMELDNQPEIEIETMLVTIANTPLIGLNNLLAPDASLEDGLLDIAVYPGFSKAELAAYFARTVKQIATADDKVQRYRARKIKIRTEPELDIAAEGLMMGKGKARLKALPAALQVIAPEPSTPREPGVKKQ